MVDLKPVVREDYEDISEVYGFIQEQVVDQEERMHIIPHGSVYNPDTFRNFEAPETLASYIPYGSAVFSQSRANCLSKEGWLWPGS